MPNVVSVLQDYQVLIREDRAPGRLLCRTPGAEEAADLIEIVDFLSGYLVRDAETVLDCVLDLWDENRVLNSKD